MTEREEPEQQREPAIIKPEGHYVRHDNRVRRTDFRPDDVTGVNPDRMLPIDPDSPYIPPA